MGGSLLKNLKNNSQNQELLRHQKQKKGNDRSGKQRRVNDQDSLDVIRNAFKPKLASKSKTQAEEQRRQTWEAEKRLQNKVGGMVDRRFGEKDNSMSEQDKMVERFAREKLNNIRRQNKKSFNIEENDTNFDDGEALLTHGGQALTFEDDFQEGDSGLAEEEERRSYEENHQVQTNHMENNDVENEKPERPKTKAEIMQEVIAKSKMHKLERQHQQQQDSRMIDELNAGFDDLMAELAPLETQKMKPKREADEYDVNVQEFAYDKRADPGDRTKTPEELAAEADERRRAAERAQVARMEGDELDIDLDYEDVKDDAHLFGLDDDDNDDESESYNEAEDTKDSQLGGHVPVKIPQSREELARLDPTIDQLRYFVKVATPGRGTGNKQQSHGFGAALVDFGIKVPQSFNNAVVVLHEMAPHHESGKFIANHIRDLVHLAKRRTMWRKSESLSYSMIGSLFSTSDQWHVVATSASLAMSQRLSSSVDVKSISQNLFLCELLLVYQRTSKRYIPEIPGYLLRLLVMLVPENKEIAERYVRSSPELLTAVEDTENKKADDIKVGAALSSAQIVKILTNIISRASSLWRSLEAYPEIFRPLLSSLKNLSKHVAEPKINQVIEQIDRMSRFSASERRHLELQNFRPIGIRTQAPMFDENYNPDIKGQGMDPEQRELQKSKALHKKERKSTLREMRRDAEFEARQRLHDKRSEMESYHNKLKRLEGQINGEEGAERNAYERERKRRRK